MLVNAKNVVSLAQALRNVVFRISLISVMEVGRAAVIRRFVLGQGRYVVLNPMGLGLVVLMIRIAAAPVCVVRRAKLALIITGIFRVFKESSNGVCQLRIVAPWIN